MDTDEVKGFGYAEFVAYHERNKHVFKELRRYAEAAHEAGREKLSIWLLANRVRWDHEVEADSPFPWKLPNGCLGYYSRLLMAGKAVPLGFFETRPMKQEPGWWLRFLDEQVEL